MGTPFFNSLDHVFDAEEAFALGRAFTISSEDPVTEVHDDIQVKPFKRPPKTPTSPSSPALLRPHSKKPPPPLPGGATFV